MISTGKRQFQALILITLGSVRSLYNQDPTDLLLGYKYEPLEGHVQWLLDNSFLRTRHKTPKATQLLAQLRKENVWDAVLQIPQPQAVSWGWIQTHGYSHQSLCPCG